MRSLLLIVCTLSTNFLTPTYTKNYYHNTRSKYCNPTTSISCNNKCVPLHYICDGVDDCLDGSDEIKCDQMEVSLKGGTRRGEGRVEIRISNITGSICGDQWDDRDAMVLCRMLGYRDVSKAKATKANQGTTEQGQGVIWMSRVSCRGHETDINQCRAPMWGEHRCNHEQDAGVACLPEPSTTTPTISFSSSSSSPSSTSSSSSSSSPSSSSSSSPSSSSSSSSSSSPSSTSSTAIPPNNQTCGKRLIHPILHKIIGGQPSTYGSHPWMARVMVMSEGRAYHLCGGTIIGDKWVLTAAHCFVKERKNLLVKVGDHHYLRNDVHEQIFAVDTIFTHKNFENFSNLLNDYDEYDDDDDDEYEDDYHIFESPLTYQLQDILAYFFNDHFFRSKSFHGIGPLKGDIALLKLKASNFVTKNAPKPKRLASKQSSNSYGMKNSLDFFKLSRRRRRSRRRLERHRNKIRTGTTSSLSQMTNAATSASEIIDATIINIPMETISTLTPLPPFNESHSVTQTTPTTTTTATTTKIKPSTTTKTTPKKTTQTVTTQPSKSRPLIQFNDFVQPACLPSASTVYESGLMCEVTGWGIVKEDASIIPTALHSAILPIMSVEECKKLFKFYFNFLVSDDSFCAGYASGKVDTCRGDSGGPLVCQVDGVHTLMGVTSRGNGCANKNSPGIYAKVANFVDWINNVMEKHD